MEQKKLNIVREELIKYIYDMNIGSDFSVVDRFELMNNIDKFLDPDTYLDNIDILNAHLKK